MTIRLHLRRDLQAGRARPAQVGHFGTAGLYGLSAFATTPPAPADTGGWLTQATFNAAWTRFEP
jgi:hypothetical protein